MKIKLLNVIPLVTLLATQTALSDPLETPKSNDENVTQHITSNFETLFEIEQAYNAIETIARTAQNDTKTSATAIRDKAYKEVEKEEKEQNSIRNIKQNWQAKERIILLSEVYATSAELERSARTVWDLYDKHWRHGGDTEDIANHMHIQYRWLTSVIRSYYDKVKEREYGTTNLTEAKRMALEDLAFMTKFTKQAKDSMDWIVSNPEGWSWEARCKVVLNKAEAALNYYKKSVSFISNTIIETSAKTIAAKVKSKKDKIDRTMYDTLDTAAFLFVDTTEQARNAIYAQIFTMNTVVEDILDAPWVNTELLFNYNMPCSLKETIAIVVVIKNYKQKELLVLNDEGLYKNQKNMEELYSTLLNLCAAITVPKSGINIQTGANDSKLQGYRHWWITATNETEEEQILSTIEQLTILQDKVKKPIYLAYRDDKEKEGVTNLINKLVALEKFELISGTILLDLSKKAITAYDKEGTEIYKSINEE